MSAPAIVEFQGVSKRFGDGPLVLDRISLSARPGEFISLIGPSGCGKSTLLRLVAGLTPVSAGSLEVNRANTPGGAGAGLAYVFQDPTLLPWLDVARNVELPHRLHGGPATQRSAARDHALRLVGLSDRHNAYPRELSGGQKMRVSIARALTLQPRILLLDEPFGALDEMNRERLNEELLAIHAGQAWTAFFVTHSVAEAVFLSDRVIVMSPAPGRIHADIPIALPKPRTAASRMTRPYLDLIAEVSQVLRSVERAA